jgi:hypothetical protein
MVNAPSEDRPAGAILDAGGIDIGSIAINCEAANGRDPTCQTKGAPRYRSTPSFLSLEALPAACAAAQAYCE